MTGGAGPRKLGLAVHVAVSVGWIGLVIAYLGLVLAGLGGGTRTRSGRPGGRWIR